jgi:CRP/FNR family transcriptional regulator, cyclic AMP receptor protein
MKIVIKYNKIDLQKNVPQLLQKIPLLKSLSTEAFEKLTTVIQLSYVMRGQTVIRKGNKDDNLYFLLIGRLQAIDLTEDGREVGLNFLASGDYFGELSVIDGLPRSATVVATENALIGVLSRSHALDLIYKNPSIVEQILKKLTGSIRQASNYRGILAIPNAFHRVFALLNQMVITAPGGLVVINNMPTQKEIAIMVNTSRETVSRALHYLIEEKIVEKDLRRLIVRKPDELRNIFMENKKTNVY